MINKVSYKILSIFYAKNKAFREKNSESNFIFLFYNL